ncbi:MAG TPA: hypothetical protein VJ821_13755 [Anaerolineales bacterium]|nr:hypothetical protein [Anaerolineales bacterium]
MPKDHQQLDEEFVKLALAINEHLPGYVDSYFGPGEWTQEAKQAGKLPLSDLTHRADQLAFNIDQANGLDSQRGDFLAHQISAMQMSLRLLAGEKVSLVEEVQALYDVQPEWKDEANFVEAQKVLNQLLPSGSSLKERMENWNKSLEIPIEKVRELLPFVTKRLRTLAREKFSLPDDESFTVEFVSNQPWGAYNWYLGDYKSRVDINTDLPIRVNRLAGLIAHEGYPGHHTELSIKESKLIRQMNYREHILTLINTPSCVISEGIATTALTTLLTDDELENWYREEILPGADLTYVDAAMMLEIGRAAQKMFGVWGNAAFMLHDQNKSMDEISRYAQKYGLSTEKEADQRIKFISNPLYRSYIFTYSVGHDLFEELFTHGDRDKNFARLLEEPVTPSQIRQWIHK